MCCGQKRAEMRNSQAQRTTPSVPQRTPANSRAQAVRAQPSPPAMQTASPPPRVNPQIRSVQPQAPMPISMTHSSISVRYLENSPIRVRGLVSGISYEFSGTAPIQQVDARDASSLLTTRFFRCA